MQSQQAPPAAELIFYFRWLVDNFALVARLNVVFLALAAVLPERVAGLARRRFAHLAFCASAIFLFTDALMVRFFVESPAELLDTPRMRPSSLLSFSIRSLIAAARLSWLTVRSYRSMRQVSIQKPTEIKGSKTLICANGDLTDVCVRIC